MDFSLFFRQQNILWLKALKGKFMAVKGSVALSLVIMNIFIMLISITGTFNEGGLV